LIANISRKDRCVENQKKKQLINKKFLTSFDFDREYLQKGSMRRKSEKKTVDQQKPLPCWAKKVGEKLVNYGPQTKML